MEAEGADVAKGPSCFECAAFVHENDGCLLMLRWQLCWCASTRNVLPNWKQIGVLHAVRSIANKV